MEYHITWENNGAKHESYAGSKEMAELKATPLRGIPDIKNVKIEFVPKFTSKPLLNWQEHCPKCGYDVLCFKPLGGNKRDYTCEDCGYKWHEDLDKKDEFGR